jgi:MFS family permease
MIAAFNLNSTWTPLVGGLLATRLGTALSSVIATSVILLGQVILLLGDIAENVAPMALGLFVFGLGISPLSVVQESIIVRFFASHGLGISLALGLIAGKGASFVSARLSYPLSEAYGPHAPFVVSTLLALFSFGVNLVYLASSAWFARGAGVELDAHELEQERRRRKVALGERMTATEAVKKVAAKKAVRFTDLKRFGDVFWLYTAINVLCGAIWAPFIHLAA